MSLIHKGILAWRTTRNPKEKSFADVWDKYADNILPELLVGDGSITQRDATLAATLIQWLGSPVGQYFLYEVQKMEG